MSDFLPISKQDMDERGWDQCDFVYVIGDAYVDHPTFGHAIISRVLENAGYKVGIISQPDWKDNRSVRILGEPRLGFLVMAGNMDSMVNHYSVSKHRRKTDAFSPGGVMGKRPDYATTVYCNLIRRNYPKKPIIIGGVEASLRRLSHYDYWSDKMKRSILLDSQADILLYGMGERSIIEVADALNSGLDAKSITWIPGSVYTARELPDDGVPQIVLPEYASLVEDKINYAKSFYLQYCNTDPFSARRLVEPYGEHEFVIQNPPQQPLTQMEMDDVYALPYARTYHPSYEAAGGIPAISEVKFSLQSNRGCFGACSFCAITFHQGRIVQTRSHESIVAEAEMIVKDPEFKGYIHDVGGPTANFRHPACEKQKTKGACQNRQCLFPTPCKNMTVDHMDYVKLLRKLRSIKGVKKVFVRSGLRFDYLMADPDDTFFRELVEHHISGQLKVAPEHVADEVLDLMGKPRNSVYQKFVAKYKQINEETGMNQFLVPYLMSSHPGSTLKEAIALAEYLRDLGYMPEQVQDFYPTPSTISTVMYYTGIDPRTMKPVYVPTNPHEKAMQRALIQYRNPKNYELVREALQLAGREDLIGFGPKCLIRPRKGMTYSFPSQNKKKEDSAKGGSQHSGSREPDTAEAAGSEKHVRPAKVKSAVTAGHAKPGRSGGTKAADNPQRPAKDSREKAAGRHTGEKSTRGTAKTAPKRSSAPAAKGKATRQDSRPSKPGGAKRR